MRNALLETAESARDVVDLCTLKARVTVISMATGGAVPASTIRAVFKELNRHPPAQGALPERLEWYFDSYQRALESTFIARRYQHYRQLRESIAQSLVRCYRDYLRTFGYTIDAAPISLDRTWFLAQRFVSRETLYLAPCKTCHATLLHRRDCLRDLSGCPSCRQLFRNAFGAARARAAAQPHILN